MSLSFFSDLTKLQIELLPFVYNV